MSLFKTTPQQPVIKYLFGNLTVWLITATDRRKSDWREQQCNDWAVARSWFASRITVLQAAVQEPIRQISSEFKPVGISDDSAVLSQ